MRVEFSRPLYMGYKILFHYISPLYLPTFTKKIVRDLCTLRTQSLRFYLILCRRIDFPPVSDLVLWVSLD